MNALDLSIVLVSWQMAREMPRTLWSLSHAFQIGIEEITYEIIVVDNGSDQMPIAPQMAPSPDLHRASLPARSPVGTINQGLSLAKGKLVGAWIDGARMASPGLIRAIYDAAKLHPKPVLAVPNWQLGPTRQAISVYSCA